MGTQIHTHAQNVKLLAENKKLRAGIDAVVSLIEQSDGVAGLHLNGEIILWPDLLEGGRFEEWLIELNFAVDPEA